MRSFAAMLGMSILLIWVMAMAVIAYVQLDNAMWCGTRGGHVEYGNHVEYCILDSGKVIDAR